MMKLHASLEWSAVVKATRTLGQDSCSHHDRRYHGQHGTAWMDCFMCATTHSECMLTTQPTSITLLVPSYECGEWPCQAPSHAKKACGLGGHRTDGRSRDRVFPQSFLPSTSMREWYVENKQNVKQ